MLGQEFRDDIQVDEAPVRYALLSGPTGMAIDEAGRLRWMPDAAGDYAIALAIRERHGAETVES